jgi:hypothetical protein
MLRVTRHPDQRKVVLSHWRDGICVASTPIELSEVSALIGVLVDALGDAATGPDASSTTSGSRPSVLSRIKAVFRPTLAKIIDLRVLREGQRNRAAR